MTNNEAIEILHGLQDALNVIDKYLSEVENGADR